MALTRTTRMIIERALQEVSERFGEEAERLEIEEFLQAIEDDPIVSAFYEQIYEAAYDHGLYEAQEEL